MPEIPKTKPRITRMAVVPLTALLLAMTLALPLAAREKDRPGEPSARDPAERPQHAEAMPCNPPRHPKRAGPPHRRKARQEAVEELLRFLQKAYPRQARYLRDLQRKDPEAFRRAISRLRPSLMRLRQIRQSNPELAELIIAQHKVEIALGRLVRQWQATSDLQERRRIMQQMRDLVARKVDIRLRRLELEIDLLQQRLQQLRRRLDRQRDQKQRLVEQELEALTRKRPTGRRTPQPQGRRVPAPEAPTGHPAPPPVPRPREDRR